MKLLKIKLVMSSRILFKPFTDYRHYEASYQGPNTRRPGVYKNFWWESVSNSFVFLLVSAKCVLGCYQSNNWYFGTENVFIISQPGLRFVARWFSILLFLKQRWVKAKLWLLKYEYINIFLSFQQGKTHTNKHARTHIHRLRHTKLSKNIKRNLLSTRLLSIWQIFINNYLMCSFKIPVVCKKSNMKTMQWWM
jgi:hypothetical protein